MDKHELFVGIEGGLGLHLLWVFDWDTPDLMNLPIFSWDLIGPQGGGTNSAPIADDIWVTVPQGSSTLSLHGTDADDDELFYSLLSNPPNGFLHMVDPLQGLASYEPYQDFYGDDSFTYRAFDGVEYSNDATVYVFVAQGHAPVADFFIEFSEPLGLVFNPPYS